MFIIFEEGGGRGIPMTSASGKIKIHGDLDLDIFGVSKKPRFYMGH